MLRLKHTFATVLAGGTLLASSLGRDFTTAERDHWAFQRIQHPKPPATGSAWGQNPVDNFVLEKLESQEMTPSAPADKVTLIRRATLDLIGLPPTPEEVAAFLKDNTAEAFEHVVDRLLLSPHYGERWARHWLDLARFAESEGFKADETRPNAWRYRDYVIKSLNNDKPYDRFLSEQIAGNELWPDDPEAFVATGFNRHYPDESNARNLMQRRQEILNDITDTVGAVFTGLTFGCARCHDHKFDPILQKDYYRLQAFFANSAAKDDSPLVPVQAQDTYNRQLAEWEYATREIRAKLEVIEAPERNAIIKDYVDKYPDEIQAALKKSPDDRSPFECQMVAKAELYLKPTSHQYIATTGAISGRLKGDKKKEWDALNAELKKFDKLRPHPMPLGTGIADLASEAPKTYVLKGGAWESPTEEVEPGFLSILNPAATPILPPPQVNSTGRRAALARLLTDPENPLVARVMVNRVWQHHFGKGIAATSSDFGFKGEKPTHPELIDWLATEFVKNGWSLKKLHKVIMLSASYQQSSQFRADAAQADPENKLLWRYPRQRLEGEVIRDASLYISGLLNPAMGGPGVYPDLPYGMEKAGGWRLSKKSEDRNRRSIYIFVKRNLRYPMFETFDMPDTHESCARRNCTTSPLQALNMMNDALTLEWARNFAARVLASAGSNRDAQIETAYRLAYGRTPAESEKSLINHFFAEHSKIIEQRLLGNELVSLPEEMPASVNLVEAATLEDFCHMLLNSNEFVYLN
jgi:hypothetical protein